MGLILSLAIKMQDFPVCELQKSKSTCAPMQCLCVVIFAVHMSNVGPDKVVINKDIIFVISAVI